MGPRWRLGLIPLEGDKSSTRTRDFAASLGAALGGTVDIHQAADYRALVAALEQQIVHFAWLPPLSAARATRSSSVVPIAVAVRNGTTSYMTGLITRKGSSIRTLKDLVSVRVAWVDRDSASGYVVIRAALRISGISLVDAFSEELFLRSHGEVARAVSTGRVDVGATCFNFAEGSVQIARTGYAGEGGLPREEVQLIAHAGPIPSDIFAAHAKVPAPTLALLRGLLVGSRPSPARDLALTLMHADRFAEATKEHAAMLAMLFDTVLAPRSNPPPRSIPPPR